MASIADQNEPLPDDVASSHAMVLAMQQELAEHQTKLKAQADNEVALTEQIALLKQQLVELRRMRFGRRSEKLDENIRQLELTLEDLETNDGERNKDSDNNDPDTSAAAEKTTARKSRARKPLPDHLPRDIVNHDDENGVCSCGGKLSKLGEDVSEMLEYVPASFRVIRHVRPKYSCRCCERITQAPAPSRPIARGYAGPALLAHVAVAKYADHRVPRVRGSKGVEIVRNFTIDEGLAPRSRLAGAGFKPLQAAEVKSLGSERCSKRCGNDHIRWDRERRTQVNRHCRVITYIGDVETGTWWLARDEGRGKPAEYSTGIWHKDGVTLYQALVRNEGTCRPDAKGAAQLDSLRESQSTDAGHRGGDFRSRVEGSVMGLDQRGIVAQFRCRHNL